jgi:hypothetical protein
VVGPHASQSGENFKTKIRNLTLRSRNLDAEVISKRNAVIRGTANYFAVRWSACADAIARWTAGFGRVCGA